MINIYLLTGIFDTYRNLFYNSAQFIPKPCSLAEVTNVFGTPGSVIPVKENVTLLMYTFLFESTNLEGALQMTGFTVNTRDGKVVDWSPITGESGKALSNAPQGSLGEQTFDIFVVTDTLTNLLKRFESEGNANTSGLQIPPALVFKAKVFSGNGSKGSGETSVRLVLSNQDASKLKRLTEANVGKRTLLVCRDKVIATPLISEPIASSQLTFTVKDSRLLDTLRKR